LERMVYDYLTSSDFDHGAWERIAIAQADWPKHRRPSFHRGLITSLDEVVSSETWREELLDDTPKLLGVEMEAGGLCAAAQMYKVPVAMIRAVSDNADPAKVDTAWRPRGMKTIATLIEAVEWAAIIGRLRSQQR
jgi:nucleoside phosphorylase